jgi:NAD(P)-dependent dehydrogenase (short-subunit alcohol dehydrogenase family)
MDEMRDKVVAVTGAASGIGRATCLRVAAAGARVLVTDLEPGGEAVAAEIRAAGGEAAFRRLDVTDEEAWRGALEEAVGRWGRLDAVVNNAGVSMARDLTETRLSDWRRVMAVNLDGTFLGTRHAVAVMRGRGGGSIVNVASASGRVGSPGASAYCASKGGVVLLTKAVALECARDRIRVNVVLPGAVRTPLWEKAEWWPDHVARTGSVAAAYRALEGATPLGRMAEPEEVAEAILYLASDASRFVTGAELAVDGGYTAQ